MNEIIKLLGMNYRLTIKPIKKEREPERIEIVVKRDNFYAKTDFTLQEAVMEEGDVLLNKIDACMRYIEDMKVGLAPMDMTEWHCDD